MKGDAKLIRFYRKYNRLFFDNSLRQDVVLVWEYMINEHATIEPFEDTLKITISGSLRNIGSLWKIFLVHEMVHVKLWPCQVHGKEFYDELLRVCSFLEYRKLL